MCFGVKKKKKFRIIKIKILMENHYYEIHHTKMSFFIHLLAHNHDF